MSVNEQFSPAESALSRAFGGLSSLCSVVCDCGRCYFVTARGHGDYEEGELDGYKAKAEEEPDKFIECWAFDSVDLVWIGGKELVVQCVCGTANWSRCASKNSRYFRADYLAERLKEEIGDLERQIADARRRSEVMNQWDRARSPEHFKGSGI